MPGLQDFALQLLQNNPRVANNPNAKAMVDVLRSGNAQQGQRIAENLCSTYGISREDAVAQAKRFFGLP